MQREQGSGSGTTENPSRQVKLILRLPVTASAFFERYAVSGW